MKSRNNSTAHDFRQTEVWKIKDFESLLFDAAGTLSWLFRNVVSTLYSGNPRNILFHASLANLWIEDKDKLHACSCGSTLIVNIMRNSCCWTGASQSQRTRLNYQMQELGHLGRRESGGGDFVAVIL